MCFIINFQGDEECFVSLYGDRNVIIAELVILYHLLSVFLNSPGKIHYTVYAVDCKNENLLVKIH